MDELSPVSKAKWPLTDRQGVLFSLKIHHMPCFEPDKLTASMGLEENSTVTILVVDDVEEDRDGIQSLLESDGYQVEAARSERYAIECAIRKPPSLILVNLTGSNEVNIAAAQRISQGTNLQNRLPVVLFFAEGNEGTEVPLGGGLIRARPDNFNDLRQLLRRLLSSFPAR